MAKVDVNTLPDEAHKRLFVRQMLEDVQALDRMITEGWIEKGVRRIGAEQELFLLDSTLQPVNKALPILARLPKESFTTELAQFNLEANLLPRVFGGTCLSDMEGELLHLLDLARDAAREEKTQLVMCGILPTLDQSHLGIESLTPIPRYKALNDILVGLRGGRFQAVIKGLDELNTHHDNVLLEACNTSFQLHWQVSAEEFARHYNIAQLVVAPLLAAGANSPVLLRHRLWHETRVALFQQSIDVRTEQKVQRGMRQRVSFGDRWVKDSILEIYRDDIARFRALITTGEDQSPLEMLDRGEVPQLKALRLHNGTVYRWNRPCYGISEGKPHFRIECRVLPAGPSVIDEMANAAFFYGLMAALPEEYGDVSKSMRFDDAKANFFAAARYGLHARVSWLGGRAQGVDTLILEHLLPLARKGLQARGVASSDIERYLGVLHERVQSGRSGAQWGLDSIAAMGEKGRVVDRHRSLTAAMIERQKDNEPVHRWDLAPLSTHASDRDAYLTVGQVMTTDLVTLHDDDIVDYAASIMEWERLRHVPVEDREGHLVGMVTQLGLMRTLTHSTQDGIPLTVGEVMEKSPVTVAPEASTIQAIELMRTHKLTALPVVRDGKLVGLVTEHDFFELTASLMLRWLKED
jgi:CBS domain-containing protein/gamma-glutamyl:cysteine ligase YbdK (ATP-grasp superfamily)